MPKKSQTQCYLLVFHDCMNPVKQGTCVFFYFHGADC